MASQPGRALLLLPGDPARDRPGRAREGGGGGGQHRAVPAGHRAAGPRDDPGRVRRSRRAARWDRASSAFREGLGAALAEQRELDFLRVLRNVPAISELGHLDVSGKEQLRVSRLEPGRRRQPGGLLAGAEVRRGAVRARRTGARCTSGTTSEPYVTLAVPVGKYAVEVTTAEVSLEAVLKPIAQIEVGARRIRLRGGLAGPAGRPSGQSGCVREKRDLSALPQVQGGRAADRSGPTPERRPSPSVAEGLAGRAGPGRARGDRPARVARRSSSGRSRTPTRPSAPRSSGAPSSSCWASGSRSWRASSSPGAWSRRSGCSRRARRESAPATSATASRSGPATSSRPSATS